MTDLLETDEAETPDEVLPPEGPQDSAPTPRKRRARRTKKAPKKRAAAPRQAPSKTVLRNQIALIYELGGQALAIPQPEIGGAIYENARPCAQAWVDYLDTNPALRERIEQAMIVGGLSGVIAAHLPIIGTAFLVLRAQAEQLNVAQTERAS